jgi:hypothetical protein
VYAFIIIHMLVTHPKNNTGCGDGGGGVGGSSSSSSSSSSSIFVVKYYVPSLT